MTNEEKEIKRLRKKYPLIVRWGRELFSFDYYIDNQVLSAEAGGAPRTAIFKKHGTEEWVTVDDWPDERKESWLAMLEET